MKKIIFTLIAIIAVSFTSEMNAQQTTWFFKEANSFFKANTQNGTVDYKSIKENPSSLEALVKEASTIDISTADAKTVQAFWINAYNILVIKGIIDNYPIKSPLDKKGFFDKTKFEVAGQKMTLNDIENKKLRATYGDARFHFVLVCGAKGCPPIISEAYMPGTLDAQLERQTKKALNRDSFIKVSGKKVAFSEIFKWYKKDFVKDGNELDFLNKYRDEKVSTDAKITYYPYDWRLNSK